MDRRRFLKSLIAIASALLVTPRAALKHLVSPLIPGRRYYHFVMSWDGGTRRTWIDGEEVFGGGAAIDGGTGIPILGEWDTIYMLPTGAPVTADDAVTIGDGFYPVRDSDQGSISFWVAPPDEARHFDGMIDEVEVHGSEISWTWMSDDSPFEPPACTDPPPTIESDVGEGEDLVDSWW